MVKETQNTVSGSSLLLCQCITTASLKISFNFGDYSGHVSRITANEIKTRSKIQIQDITHSQSEWHNYETVNLGYCFATNR